MEGGRDKIVDGFWLPAALREQVLADVSWENVWLRGGALHDRPVDGAVAVRWPRLGPAQWGVLRAGLQQGRSVPAGEAAARWEAASKAAFAALLADAATLLPILAAATGYSEAMLAAALGGEELLGAGALSRAMAYRPTWSVARRWETMPELPGKIRFFPAGPARGLAALRPHLPLFRPAPVTDLALGYAAGNVPGTGLLIALLGALANQASAGSRAPAVLVRNSRHEPLLAAQALNAIEAADPELTAGVAIMIWDYADGALQAELMRSAGLMIAAAGDETIGALAAQRARAPRCRFHAHGHKASFTVIEDPTPESARLAALDSTLWDQNGCLSARVHFVAGDVEAYGRHLADAMRELAARIPRGATPRRFVHRAFDSYTAMGAGTNQTQVYSDYDEDFAVIVDRRPWDGDRFRRTVNTCQGRVVVVRPVDDALEAARMLRWLPPANLQSMSASLGQTSGRLFADAAGAAGVTAIRPLGRAAFPQLAYSWDGLLPLDVAYVRPAGHFTTIEFDAV